MLSKKVDYSDREIGSEFILDLYNPDTPSRQLVEHFIHRVFARAYEADINQYLPQLMALHNKNKRMVAALGMREASSNTLFLESYLDAPVEDFISQLHGSNVTRNQIMEVGNLASIHRGGLSQLIIALTSYLYGAGSEWVVFTAVPAVREAFAALDLNLHLLAPADKSRLTEAEQKSWGRYYETIPVVVVGRVEEGYQRIRDLIRLEKTMSLNACLWRHAFAMGCQQPVAIQTI